MLQKALKYRGFVHLSIDPLVFCKGDLIFLVYLDNVLGLIRINKTKNDLIQYLREEMSVLILQLNQILKTIWGLKEVKSVQVPLTILKCNNLI